MSFREASSQPCWAVRSRKLSRAMRGRALRAAEMISLGRHEFGWNDDETRNVLAAGEGTEFFEREGVWRSTRAVERTGT